MVQPEGRSASKGRVLGKVGPKEKGRAWGADAWGGVGLFRAKRLEKPVTREQGSESESQKKPLL